MTIRELAIEDADFIDSAKDFGFLDGWNKNMVLSAINGGRFFGGIAEENNIPVGFITYSLGYDDADIESIFILPDKRKQGYAKELISFSMERIKKADKKSIFLEVKESNISAISLYLSFGFKKVSIRKKYYADGSNAIVMQKEI